MNDTIISKLHPSIRTMAKNFISKAKAEGIDLKITFGTRTFEEQQKLYNQGRTTPGAIVTKAKPGRSFHNYSLAIDVVPIVNGKADWESKLWDKIGEIGESVGFDWGGRWKTIVDRPHFQFPRNTRYTHLLQLRENGKVDKDGYLIL